MVIFKAEPVLKLNGSLAEGPVWHAGHEKLYFVDIDNMEVNSFDPRTGYHHVWLTKQMVSAIIPATNNNLILTMQGEIVKFDVSDGSLTRLMEIESGIFENRCNDAKCDMAGRLWVGTMHIHCKPERGSLYCIDTEFNAVCVLTKLTIPNGLGWSLSGEEMYFIDSYTGTVKSYRYEPASGNIADERIIVCSKSDSEIPDGMCVDSEGMLWVAFWGGHRVGRYHPGTGIQLGEIEIPAPYVTSCAFGGEDLQTLYITTARKSLSEQELNNYPLSGSVFSVNPGVRGVPDNFFPLRQKTIL